MQLTHHPRRKCVKLVAELNVGAFTLGGHTSGDIACQVPRTNNEEVELWAVPPVDVTTSKAEAGKHNLLARSSMNSGGTPRKAGGTGTPTLQKPSCSLLSCPS